MILPALVALPFVAHAGNEKIEFSLILQLNGFGGGAAGRARSWATVYKVLLSFSSFSSSSMAVANDFVSSDIDNDPFRNGFVHERGPLAMRATASDKLMCAIPYAAGLECCRLATGRGMIVLPMQMLLMPCGGDAAAKLNRTKATNKRGKKGSEIDFIACVCVWRVRELTCAVAAAAAVVSAMGFPLRFSSL